MAGKAAQAKDFTIQRARRAGSIVDEIATRQETQQVTHSGSGGTRVWRGQAALGFGKVRYRGLQKNITRAFTALALGSIE